MCCGGKGWYAQPSPAGTAVDTIEMPGNVGTAVRTEGESLLIDSCLENTGETDMLN